MILFIPMINSNEWVTLVETRFGGILGQLCTMERLICVIILKYFTANFFQPYFAQLLGNIGIAW